MVYVDGSIAFIKHSNVHMEGASYVTYDKVFDAAKKRGVMTNEQSEALIKENMSWTKEDEAIIEALEREIEENEGLKKSVRFPSQVQNLDRKLAAAREKLNAKDEEKRALMGITAEVVAQSKANDALIISSFFKDRYCKEPFYGSEDYEDLDREKIFSLIRIYTEMMKSFSDDVIQRLVLSDYFSPYFHICDDPQSFFGAAGIELSKIQLSIMFYVKIFKNIFEHVPNIPDKIRQDPRALLEFSQNFRLQQDGQAKNKAGANNNSSGRVLFGANKNDVEALAQHDESVVSLNEEIVKRGGGSHDVSLNDFLKMPIK